MLRYYGFYKQNKPYYNPGGFFDVSERISDWIDNKLYLVEEYGIWILVPSKRVQSLVHELHDMKWIEEDLQDSKDSYNKNKFFWMQPK